MSEMSEYSDKQLLYLDWLAISKYERKPATEQLLAKEIGVTDRTLRRWKNLPGFREAITQRAREFLNENLPEIYGALQREAIKGNFQHIRLALELTGEYAEKQRVEHSGKIQTEDVGLTDEDRANKILAILDRARERRDRQANSGD